MSDMKDHARRGVYVGIDTSNYTTSVALCDEQGRVTANLKRPLPVKQGECGLRQSDAVFAHVRNLPCLMEELQQLLHPASGEPLVIEGVGYSATPRPSEGSYMPCFLVGEAAARALGAVSNAPVIPFSHQEGHIVAALYSADAMQLAAWGRTDPFVAFHVSGGTTDVVLVRPRGERFDIEPLGGSKDLHAGQAIDRIGVMLGLQFPCGPALEQLALTHRGQAPKPRICVDGFDCHLSGLENLARSLYEKSKDAPCVAAYTLDFIATTLVALAKQARRSYPRAPMVFSGGVMSNRRIQASIAAHFDACFAEPSFSADNAAGIALLCRRSLLKDRS